MKTSPPLWLRALRHLPRNALSRLAGRVAAAHLPRPLVRAEIALFARAVGADLDEMQEPAGGFATLQDFFTRALRKGVRPIDPAPETKATRLVIGDWGYLVQGLWDPGCDAATTECEQRPIGWWSPDGRTWTRLPDRDTPIGNGASIVVPAGDHGVIAIDGASAWQRTIHVIIPTMRNTIIFVVTVTTILAFRLFVQPYLMTRGGPGNSTLSLIQSIYEMTFLSQNLGRACAAAFLFLIWVGFLTLLQRLFLREERA